MIKLAILIICDIIILIEIISVFINKRAIKKTKYDNIIFYGALLSLSLVVYMAITRVQFGLNLATFNHVFYVITCIEFMILSKIKS
jgi:hypothetical protein